MQSTRAPAKTIGARATALLMFAVAPAMAATGIDVLCDRSADHLHVHDPDTLELEVVDHGLDNEMASGARQAAETPLSMTPRDEKILRRIFDEAAPTEGAPDEESNSAGMEERTPDVAGTDAVDPTDSDDALPDVRLPDLSDAERLRFRREMFRTDI